MRANRWKRLRLAMGFDRLQWAVFVGVSEATVYRWEAGTNQPTGLSLKTLEKLEDTQKREAREER